MGTKKKALISGAITMDSPENLAILGTQDEDNQDKKNTQDNMCWTPLHAKTPTTIKHEPSYKQLAVQTNFQLVKNRFENFRDGCFHYEAFFQLCPCWQRFSIKKFVIVNVSCGISYQLRAICWNITTYKQKVYQAEIEISS